MKYRQDIEGKENLKQQCLFLRSSDDGTGLTDAVFNCCDLDVTLRFHMTGTDSHFQTRLRQILLVFPIFFVTLLMRYMLF